MCENTEFRNSITEIRVGKNFIVYFSRKMNNSVGVLQVMCHEDEVSSRQRINKDLSVKQKTRDLRIVALLIHFWIMEQVIVRFYGGKYQLKSDVVHNQILKLMTKCSRDELQIESIWSASYYKINDAVELIIL